MIYSQFNQRTEGTQLYHESVTRGMFGANRKKFMEGGLDSDYSDDSGLYYSQQSMFPPHRPDKDMLASSSSSTSQLSQLGASLYGPQSALGFPMRGMNSSAAPPLCRTGLNQSASQLTSHTSTPNSSSLHTPPSPSRGILPMSSRSVLNHNQQVGGPTGQAGGIGAERGGGGGGGRSGTMGSPSRSSPSIIGMPKQPQSRQPFTFNRNPGFNMNSSLSNNIFNGTDGSENVTGLDLSDFPALADRSRRDGGANAPPQHNPLAGRAPYVGMVTKPSNEQSQDFSIHNEDFPALPGPNYQTKDPTSTSEDTKTNLNSSGKTSSSSDGPKFPGDKSSAPNNNNQQKKGIQVLPDGEPRTVAQ
uniref:CCR4-NOT transcription complex subunit 2 n=1 Tax=Nothobranchius furzeri TaxID=105023 RepID=A0A8C6NU11_NOTFU